MHWRVYALHVPRLRVHAISMSVDGYVAGPDQDVDHPLGVGGERLHQWIYATRSFKRMVGADGGERGVDDDYFAAGFDGIGSTIIGRNMFGPVRGPWSTPRWDGGWGDVPPYHHDVYVLTNHERAPLVMDGGTTFHFVTEGPERALELARASAGPLDVRLGGGAQTIREYLALGVVDEMHVALSPVLLGDGERLFVDGDTYANLDCVKCEATDAATHFTFAAR